MKSPPNAFTVSVGNIAFGGRGKTPTVAHITRLLLEMGERPAILSRGYGRRRVEDGVVVVSDGRRILADLDRAGDEPLMLARELPGVAVLVCEQRAIAGTMARLVYGATALVLDDGFQHRQMPRDVDLVLVTGEDLDGARAPFGRLREPVSSLARADALLKVGTYNDLRGRLGTHNDLRGRFRGPVFAVERQLSTPVPITPGESPLAAGAPVFALAGIADPERFTRAAADSGYTVAGSWAPGDHYRYTAADIERLANDMTASGAIAVLTTSKDAVRLLPLRPLPVPVHEWPLRIVIEPATEFESWLRRRRDEARVAPAAQVAQG